MSTAESAIRSRTLEWSDPVATAAAGAEMAGLDYLRAVIAGELGRPPISITMNMVPVELEEGRRLRRRTWGGALAPCQATFALPDNVRDTDCDE